MRIGSAGSTNINVLQSDRFTYRNSDYAVAQNTAYFAGVFLGVTGSEIAEACLFNPSGSGITVILDEFSVSFDADTEMILGYLTSELPDTFRPNNNSRIGQPSGLAEVQYSQDATSSGIALIYHRLSANTEYTWRRQYAYILDEGYGIIVKPGVSAVDMAATFWWREV